MQLVIFKRLKFLKIKKYDSYRSSQPQITHPYRPIFYEWFTEKSSSIYLVNYFRRKTIFKNFIKLPSKYIDSNMILKKKTFLYKYRLLHTHSITSRYGQLSMESGGYTKAPVPESTSTFKVTRIYSTQRSSWWDQRIRALNFKKKKMRRKVRTRLRPIPKRVLYKANIPDVSFSNYNIINELSKNIYARNISINSGKKWVRVQNNLINVFLLLKFNQILNTQVSINLNQIILSKKFLNYYVKLVTKKFRKFASSFGGFPKLVSFIKISFLMLITKDITYFSAWFKSNFEEIPYRKHKRLLYFIKLFFKNYLFIYLHFFNCRGFFIKISGKISVGGNSKKRRYTIRVGSNSLTSKHIKFNYANGVVRTAVGVLGFRQMLHFI